MCYHSGPVSTFAQRDQPLAPTGDDHYPLRTFGLMLLTIQAGVVVLALLARYLMPPA